MKREIQERICDECGKVKQALPVFKINPFRGWVSSQVHGTNPCADYKLDFCSAKCAGKHFTDWKKVPKKEKE